MFGTIQELIIKNNSLFFLSRNYADLNYADLNYLVVMKEEEEYDHNYRNNKGDVECEIRILRRSLAMHASYRVYLTATLLASLLTLVNPPLS